MIAANSRRSFLECVLNLVLIGLMGYVSPGLRSASSYGHFTGSNTWYIYYFEMCTIRSERCVRRDCGHDSWRLQGAESWPSLL